MGKSAARGEEFDWAVKVAITVEDEGLGKLEGDGGFACAGGADEEEGLGEGGEEVSGGFHFVGLVKLCKDWFLKVDAFEKLSFWITFTGIVFLIL